MRARRGTCCAGVIDVLCRRSVKHVELVRMPGGKNAGTENAIDVHTSHAKRHATPHMTGGYPGSGAGGAGGAPRAEVHNRRPHRSVGLWDGWGVGGPVLVGYRFLNGKVARHMGQRRFGAGAWVLRACTVYGISEARPQYCMLGRVRRLERLVLRHVHVYPTWKGMQVRLPCGGAECIPHLSLSPSPHRH